LGVLRFGRAAAPVRHGGAVLRREIRAERTLIAHNGLMDASRARDDHRPAVPNADPRRPWRRVGVAAVACTMALTALGCGAGDEAAPRTPTASTVAAAGAATTASTAAVPDLRGVAVDVRRDPG
jgi:hypothetical protein